MCSRQFAAHGLSVGFGPSSMASGCRSSSSYASSRAWPKAWASGVRRGCSRVDPHTVLQWLVEAAEQLQAFSRHVLHDVRVRQVQLDELFALLSAVKAGEVSQTEALERLERTPQWVWVAMDPESKLVLAIDVGERTLALAQRVVHQVVQVLAPGCTPLFLTDGFRAYMTALLTHYGHWMQPPRRQDKGPCTQATVAATARAALCAGDQDRGPAAPGARESPRGVRDPRGRRAGARGVRLADQHGLYRGATRWLKEDQDPRADRTVKSCVTQFSMRV